MNDYIVVWQSEDMSIIFIYQTALPSVPCSPGLEILLSKIGLLSCKAIGPLVSSTPRPDMS